MGLLLLWAMLAVAAVAVCSVLETTLFSVRVSALGERKVAGSTGAAKLLDIMRPFLFVTAQLVRLFARAPKERFTRREFALLVGSAPREGALSLAEASLIGNLIYSREITLKDVIPLAVAFVLDANGTVGDLLPSPQADAFSRIPLYRLSRERGVGYLSHRDVLKAYAQPPDPTRPLHDFPHPIPQLAGTVQGQPRTRTVPGTAVLHRASERARQCLDRHHHDRGPDGSIARHGDHR